MSNLIQEIIATAKDRGITQQELAVRAGIHPVTLSRASKTGKCSIEIVSAMAAEAGLRLVCVPDTDLAERLSKGEVF